MRLDYATNRTVFGQPIGRFKTNRFVLAGLVTDAHTPRCSSTTASAAAWHLSRSRDRTCEPITRG